jgi:hypothetical protein
LSWALAISSKKIGFLPQNPNYLIDSDKQGLSIFEIINAHISSHPLAQAMQKLQVVIS